MVDANDFTCRREPNLTRATLTDLPTEILLKVLAEDQEFDTRRSLRRLRFVSRGLNDIVKHRVAEYLRIRGDLEKVEDMLAKPSIFDESARTLRLEGFQCPLGDRGWSSLAGLVTKLKGVRTVEWVHHERLNQTILEAIASLPLLENIKLTFSHTSPSDSLGLPEMMLSKLKSIDLEFSVIDLRTMKAIGNLVVNAHNLEHLAIRPIELDSLDIRYIDTEIARQKDFRPTLRSIIVNSITPYTASPSVLSPFLSHLSSLEIQNGRNCESNRNIWSTLRQSGIRLVTIKVGMLSIGLENYLRGYRGLQAFQVGNSTWAFGPGSSAVIDSFLKSALTEHRTTLLDLRFCAARDSSYVHHDRDYVSIPENSFATRPLFRFRRLERLDFVFAVGRVHIQERVNTMLNDLAALSNELKILYIYIVGVQRHRSHPYYPQASSDPLRTILDALKLYRFGICPQNWENLQVVIRTFESNFTIDSLPQIITHIGYQVKPIEDGKKYGLEMDYALTELLNEGNDYVDVET